MLLHEVFLNFALKHIRSKVEKIVTLALFCIPTCSLPLLLIFLYGHIYLYHLNQPKLLLFIFGERKTFSFVILFQDAQETLKHWTFVDKTDYN